MQQLLAVLVSSVVTSAVAVHATAAGCTRIFSRYIGCRWREASPTRRVLEQQKKRRIDRRSPPVVQKL
jgi:hypothetical protein